MKKEREGHGWMERTVEGRREKERINSSGALVPITPGGHCHHGNVAEKG